MTLLIDFVDNDNDSGNAAMPNSDSIDTVVVVMGVQPQKNLDWNMKIYRGEEILQTRKVGKTFSLWEGQTASALH